MTQPPRRRDARQRRERIIDATLEVITDRGISGLSHRRVAKVAEVPLSATNYYFGTLDDLIEAAFAEAIERDRALMRDRLDAGSLADDPISAIAEIALEQIADRAAGVRAMELFVAALRSEHLRELARDWDDSFHEALVPHLGEEKARVASTLMEALVQRGLIADPPMTREHIVAMLRTALGAPDPSDDLAGRP